ncbi:CDP-diacylglycerol diphosphatase, partial [Mycobacterium hodleri]
MPGRDSVVVGSVGADGRPGFVILTDRADPATGDQAAGEELILLPEETARGRTWIPPLGMCDVELLPGGPRRHGCAEPAATQVSAFTSTITGSSLAYLGRQPSDHHCHKATQV